MSSPCMGGDAAWGARMMVAEQLFELARAGAADKRRQLLHALSDCFLIPEVSRTESENELFSDIARRLTNRMAETDRAAFAERIADKAALPADLAHALGVDAIMVARPVLERSPALRDEHLCAIVQSMGEDYRLAVTARKELSEPVSNALVKFGGDEVHGRLALHPRAVLPRAMRDMVQAAKMAEKQAASQKPSYSSVVVAQEVIKRVQSGKSSVDSEVKALSERGLIQVIGHALGAIAETRPETALNVLKMGKPEPLLILLKAAGGSFESIRAIVRMQAELRKARMPDVEHLVADFDASDLASAQRVICFVNLRQTVELERPA